MTGNKAGPIKSKALRKRANQNEPKKLETGRLLRELMSEAVEVVEGGQIKVMSRTEFMIRCRVINALRGNVQAALTVLKWQQGDILDLEFDDRPISMTEREFAIAKVSGRVPRGASVRKNGKPLPDSAVEEVFRFRKGMSAREAAELYEAEIQNSDPDY